MQFKPPKNDDKYRWTNHVKGKMIYYGISEGLIKRIVRFPKRKELGIAEKTIAVMQPTSNKKKPQEVWVMYQQIKSDHGRETISFGKKMAKFIDQETMIHSPLAISRPKVRIISAWRYPGISPVGKKITIPEEILSAVAEMSENDFSD